MPRNSVESGKGLSVLMDWTWNPGFASTHSVSPWAGDLIWSILNFLTYRTGLLNLPSKLGVRIKWERECNMVVKGMGSRAWETLV